MGKEKMDRRNKGFSLVELIIVIAIMAILAAAIGIALIRYLEKGRQAKDIYNASLIKDALNIYPFPSKFQGTTSTYTDPNTGASETFKRGWVYVDNDEVRCSDASTALAMIEAGLVYVSPSTVENLKDNEENPVKWYPPGKDHDYIGRSAVGEYVFRNNITVQARNTWNTYQLDVFIDDGGELHMGASASNANRTSTHAKDAATSKMFAKKLGFENAMVAPIGENDRGEGY